MTSLNVRGDDEALVQDSPWWIRAAVVLGVPSVIACVLVWFLMATVSASLVTLVADSHATREAVEKHERTSASTARYLRLICVNTAKSDYDRSSCALGGQ